MAGATVATRIEAPVEQGELLLSAARTRGLRGLAADFFRHMVDIAGTTYPAEVSQQPLYDPKNERIHM